MLDTLYNVPASKGSKVCVPATTVTFDGNEYAPCMQSAVDNTNWSVMITPPQTGHCHGPKGSRIVTWYGNWSGSAASPPKIRSVDSPIDFASAMTNKAVKVIAIEPKTLRFAISIIECLPYFDTTNSKTIIIVLNTQRLVVRNENKTQDMIDLIFRWFSLKEPHNDCEGHNQAHKWVHHF